MDADALFEGPTEYRHVRTDDIPGIVDLYNKAILPVWLDKGRDHDFERIVENIRSHIDDEKYILKILKDPEGNADSAPLGYIAWEIHRDHTSDHIIAHLRMILVRPDHRKKAIGKRLMEDFEMEAAKMGCTKVLFDVLKGSPANAFYEKLGFRHWSNYMEKLL